MGVSFVFDLVSNGFLGASFFTLTTAILLGVSFYESYAKDKIILKLKEEKYK